MSTQPTECRMKSAVKTKARKTNNQASVVRFRPGARPGPTRTARACPRSAWSSASGWVGITSAVPGRVGITLSLRLSGDNKLLVFKPARLRLSLSKPLVRVGPGLAPAALADSGSPALTRSPTRAGVTLRNGDFRYETAWDLHQVYNLVWSWFAPGSDWVYIWLCKPSKRCKLLMSKLCKPGFAQSLPFVCTKFTKFAQNLHKVYWIPRFFLGKT